MGSIKDVTDRLRVIAGGCVGCSRRRCPNGTGRLSSEPTVPQVESCGHLSLISEKDDTVAVDELKFSFVSWFSVRLFCAYDPLPSSRQQLNCDDYLETNYHYRTILVIISISRTTCRYWYYSLLSIITDYIAYCLFAHIFTLFVHLQRFVCLL